MHKIKGANSKGPCLRVQTSIKNVSFSLSSLLLFHFLCLLERSQLRAELESSFSRVHANARKINESSRLQRKNNG